MNNDKDVRVFFVHKHSTEEYTHLRSHDVTTQVPDLNLLEFVERNAPGWIQDRLKELRWVTAPEFDIYLWPEPPAGRTLGWKEKHVATAAKDGKLHELALEDGIDPLKGRTSWNFVIIFETSRYDFLVFEEKPNSYESYGSKSIIAFPGDDIQVIYDAAHSYILAMQGTSVTATIQTSTLYEVKGNKYLEEYKAAREEGYLDPDVRMRQFISHEKTRGLRDIRTANLLFIFELKLTRPLQIPFAVFHRQSDNYRFLCQNRADTTSEDTVTDLHEAIRKSIRIIPAWNRETGYIVAVFEPKEAFKSAYNKPSDELKNLKLDNESFRDEMCFPFLPQNKLSCWREGQTLIAVFSVTGQSRPSRASIVDNFSRLRIANDPPSIIAKVENYKSIQGSERQRILDDRPHKDELIAPISLLYQPFGYFRDIRHGVKVPGEERINKGELKEKVDALANEMLVFHKFEDDRCSLFNKHLEYIFNLTPNSINASRLSGSKKISDGHLNGAHGAMVVCVECKNELSAASCEPIPQLTSYIATSFKEQAKDKVYKELFERWRIPALGITHVGPTIQFFGVISLERIRVVPLTPSLPMVDPAGEEFRWDLFLAFKAACLFLSEIQFDIGEFLKVLEDPTASLPLTMTTETCRFPSPTEIDTFATETDASSNPDKIKFVLNNRYDKSENRHLYQATIVSPTQQNDTIYVKFSRRYSVDLHYYCASKGLAPKILGFKRLSGGWLMVAMEKINTVDREKIVSPSNAEKWEKDVRELVDGFHRKGLVHGDLRLANFVFAENPERMLLVDFDWGGKEGEATFPHELLTEELGVQNDELLDRPITKDHDQRCLDDVFQWLRGAGKDFERLEREMEV